MKNVRRLLITDRHAKILAIFFLLCSACEFIADFNPPQIDIVAPSDGSIAPEGTITIAINVTDKNFSRAEIAGDGTLLCRVESEGNSTCQWQVLYNPNSSNQHSIKVKAFDKGGNRSEKTSQFYVSASPCIYFNSNRDGNQEIYRMNVDGTNVKRITNTSWSEQVPRVSPDGTKVLFSSNQSGPVFRHYIMNVDGTDVRPLPTYDYEDSPTSHAWYPDGQQVVFSTQIDNSPQPQSWSPSNVRLFTLNWNDLANSPMQILFGYDGNPSESIEVFWNDWSPNGRYLTYHHGHTPSNDSDVDIFIFDFLDGSRDAVTTDRVQNTRPAWSPDGTKILFTDRSSICVINPDGTNEACLAEGNWPRWSPDGNKIVFNSDQDGRWHIYIMNVDGTGVVQLSQGNHDNLNPDWSKR